MSTSSGKTAIVTGASSGIGRATAEALVRSGYTVFGTSRKIGESATQVRLSLQGRCLSWTAGECRGVR